MNRPICLGITGASGAIYAVRLIEVLIASGRDVHLSISPAGKDVIRQELQWNVDLDNFQPSALLPSAGASLTQDQIEAAATRIHYHHWRDFMAPIASGSFLTGGMVVCPCSGTTLSAIAAGAAGNLIQRAAEVHLKERRPIVVVPRETPLSLAHIDNMRRATEAGVVVLPASPGWYHGVQRLEDLVDFIVGRICDQLNIENALMKRWGVDIDS